MNGNDFIPTRRSLLSRLKNWDDQESWQEFFDTYGRLVYGVAVKAGLSDAEAQDVVQETIIIVARKLAGFKYDPALGSFKSWLMLITRRRIEKQLKKRMPVKVGQASRLSGAGGTPALLLRTHTTSVQVRVLESQQPPVRIVVTPHIAAATHPPTAAPIILDNIRRFEEGQPLLNRVDPARGY